MSLHPKVRTKNGRSTARRFASPAASRKGVRGTSPHLEALEQVVLLSTVTWTNPAGGDWDTKSNWRPETLPTSGDDVVINEPGNVTINHSASATDTAKSITAHDPVNLSGGTLAVTGTFSDSAAVTLLGGTLATATIASGTTLQTSLPGNGYRRRARSKASPSPAR